MSARFASVTLDVDALRHYHAIHGLPAPSTYGIEGDAAVDAGVRRFLELCDRLDVRSTLFVVGRDVDDSDALRSLLRAAVNDGHEIASHSYAHDYALAQQSPASQQADVSRSLDVIERAVGTRPRGFRAPGYNLSETLLDALELAGLAWDSSVMPSPLYWTARAAAIGAHALRGAPSTSIVGDARAFAPTTPAAPYRPTRGAYHRAARSRVEGRDLVEVPIATSARAPWLGTTIVQLPLPGAAAATAAALTGSGPVVLELHAIDFVDVDDDGIVPDLARLQRELRVPLRKKLARLESVLRMLAQAREVDTVSAVVDGVYLRAPAHAALS